MMQERMGTICLLVAGCSTLLLISVLLFMVLESWPVWSAVSPLAFILGTDWNPLAEPLQLGIGTMILSTLWTALGALLLAVPLGLCCAIFLAEFAPQWMANILRPVLNLLTGIPSVVYGFLGATVLVKFFEINFAMASGESLFCASLVLTIMVLPYIISTSESALRAIPPEYRQVSLALGVSKPYLTLRVLLPLAKRGLLGAIILSFGRAAGETMAVLMLAGNTMVLPTSWFSKGEPLPALIALELGTSEVGSLHYQGLFAAGLVLLLFVLGMNLLLALFRRDRRSGVS
ncbi:phosphate ABC transporter permease subunit PstC [Desulforamulus aeronauticus]|uniref:Phosphate transport system permease protein n=1 Tax=Desulforamulus aeronauticus DSM 10349 TaxID=1121421 RepID=A0A1M6VKV3_9FIRM|nr:phosphate ABC transporter permease subunit PstC [Desulforamulus aeronauticus]SHK82098.1 phosphate ABC transporter membrane protein 1, PhoT family [Desulforamulus aeronauticus DSM 10349]